MLTEKQKMIAGKLYLPGDYELVSDRTKSQSLQRRCNATIVGETAERAPLLADWLGAFGKGCALKAPFYADYGYNIFLGDDVFFNYGCVLLDFCAIRVGDRTQIGPMVQILTADHPRDAAARDAGFEFGKPVTIGRKVWVGGGALILPGLAIADDAIIGAGAVVTRDVAAGLTVAGNPARPLVGRSKTD
jgi:maltose O-acetyltransferase